MEYESCITEAHIAEAKALYEEADGRSPTEFRRIYRQKYMCSDHWKALKRDMEHADRPKQCEFCRTQNNIQCHHLQYRHWWNVTVEDLAWLCDSCHTSVSEAQRTGQLSKNRASSVFLAIQTGKFLASAEQLQLATEVSQLNEDRERLQGELARAEAQVLDVATPQVITKEIEVVREKPVVEIQKRGIPWIAAVALAAFCTFAGMHIDGDGPLFPGTEGSNVEETN